MDWSGMDWSRVDRSRVRSWGILRHALIFDISNISSITSSVSMIVNYLSASVRESNSVGSNDRCGIRVLLLTKAGTRVLIMNAVLKGVWLSWFSVGWGGVAVGRSRVNRNWVHHWGPVNNNRGWMGNDRARNHRVGYNRMSYDRADCHWMNWNRVDDTAGSMVGNGSTGCGNS